MTVVPDRYELAVRASNEALWDWDLQTDRIFYSARLLHFLGLSSKEGEAGPEQWLDRVHPDDLEWLYAVLRGQLGVRSAPFHLEHRVRHGADGWRWLLCRGVAVPGADGRPVRLVGSVADITERKTAEEALRLSEERYALAAAAANDGLFDWDLAKDTIYYSPRWKALLGLSDAKVGNSPDEWFSRVHPEDMVWLQATLDAQVGGGGRAFHLEYRMHDAAGGVRWMLCRGIAVLDDFGEPKRVVGSQSDITDRKTAEAELRRSEERYALAARGANDGLWDWNLVTEEAYFSPRWHQMLGIAEADACRSIDDWFSRVISEDLPTLRTAIDVHLQGGSDHLEQEFRMRHADGAELWFQARGLAVRDPDGRAVRMAGSLTDITARKRAERQLLFDAFHDGLTGLANRNLLVDRIGQALARRRGGRNEPFAVLLVDLDRFKAINESLGPIEGDSVLMTMAARIEKERKPSDTVARISADEFALLVEDVTDTAGAIGIAAAIARAIAQPIRIGRGEVVLTASVGIALSSSGYEDADDMLRDASLAMYRAKTAGRNRVEVYDEQLRERAVRHLRIEADLRAALDRGELMLHYQPIIDLQTGALAGFEALTRWAHPERGMIPPSEFIPVAEETGLIVPMGRWVAEEAARQLEAWVAAHPGRPLFMSVNVSGKQFRDDDLVRALETVLERHPGIEPSAIKLEITESLLMEDPRRSEDVMLRLKALGLHLSLDDFGTGYSSLSYLSRFPLDTLKIDRSFTRGILGGGQGAEIVRVIGTLARTLRMDVVAEGIEKEAEVDFLRALPARWGQGYLFGRPLAPDAAAALIAGAFAEASG
ncbi:sensor domain-containing protein [Arenibaculum pallidiluteum]|uniref:sensor domain-containing protein n=1 Tax=Arenibaculum pallidiluteum TaxID=2812559 RepID=UPI001A966B49|nr:EAL domain-containing protein [Arenibaculum pallidiluteum]